MKVVLCEHHFYRSLLRVGSHAIAGELKRRGHRITWVAHPRTAWLQTLRREPLPPSALRHDDGTTELALTAWAPYVNLPGLGSAFWGKRWLRMGRARRTLELAGAGECDLLWISDFTLLPLVELIHARSVVFRVFDQLDHFRWMPRSVFAMIRRYQGYADLVIASSRGVQERLATEGIASKYVPNGADLSGFNREAACSEQRENLAVYLGALEPWFDLSAVELWAAELPGVSFEIAGPNPHGLRSRLPNVRFLGPVPRSAIPPLLQRAKLGLIPFQLDRLTRSVHPLKLYEYLAAGCPVLSSDLPEVRFTDGVIFKYTEAHRGVVLVERAMHGSFARGALYDLARRNSWSQRLHVVLEMLAQPNGAASEEVLTSW